MGHLEEGTTGTRHDDLNVGKSNDKETTKQSEEEMAMGASYAASVVALR